MRCLDGQEQGRQIDRTVSTVPPFIGLAVTETTRSEGDGPRVASPAVRLEFIQPDGYAGPACERTPLPFRTSGFRFLAAFFLWSP